MHLKPSLHLHLPDDVERAALASALTLDDASSHANAALSVVLNQEGDVYMPPWVTTDLAVSPMWRLMCAELLLLAHDAEAQRLAFLMASARLFLAGSEAERQNHL